MQCPDLSASIIEEDDGQAGLIGDSWEIVGCTTRPTPQTQQQTQTQPQTQSQSLLRGCTLDDQQITSVGCTTRTSESISESNSDKAASSPKKKSFLAH